MDFIKRHWRETLISLLVLSNITIWLAIYHRRSSDVLVVYFLDVGQGDAVLIDSPQHSRVLIDGGRNRKVLSELGKILPFGDRRIDVVVATHPDADHIGGLPEVISRYKVGLVLEPGVESDNTFDDELERKITEKGVPKFLARRGMVINFGDGTRLQVLFPIQDVSNWETNRASIVARLVYGESEFLLTGDSPIQIENVLVSLDPTLLDADVLKVGHHGSRTSTSLVFAEAVSPEYAVISAGRDNSYGHPHQEVLDRLKQVGAAVVSTAEVGTIKFETDGKTLEVK